MEERPILIIPTILLLVIIHFSNIQIRFGIHKLTQLYACYNYYTYTCWQQIECFEIVLISCMNNCGGRPNCEIVPFNYGYHLNILVARLSMKTKRFRYVYTWQEIRRPTKEIRRPTTLPNTRMAPNKTHKINIKIATHTAQRERTLQQWQRRTMAFSHPS